MRLNRLRTLERLLVATIMSAVLATTSHAEPQGKIAVDLQMSLDAGSPNPVFSGDDVSWGARVTLVSGSPVSPGGFDVQLNANSVPSGVSLAVSGSDWSCTGLTCSYLNGLEIGMATSDLIIIGSAPFTPSPGQIDLSTLVGVVDSLFFDSDVSNNSASNQVLIDPDGFDDFFIQSIDATPDPVGTGGNVTFTLVAGAVGVKERPARGLSFAMDYVLSSAPGGATLIGNPSGTGWSCSTTGCNYNADLFPGQLSDPLTFVATTQSQPGTMTLDALIVSDSTPSNNAAQRVVTVTGGGPDYLISSITGSPNPIDAGALGTFEVQIARFGIPSGIDGSTGTLDPELSFNLSSTPSGAVVVGQPAGNGWNCASTTCTYTAALPFNTPSAPLVFNVQAPPNGPGSMTLDVLLTNDSNNGNNAGTSTLSVNGSTQLDYRFTTFAGSPNPALVGSVIEFQVAVTQDGGGSGGGTVAKGTIIGTPGLSFDYNLDATPGSAALIGAPSGGNWSCSSSNCAYSASLSDGQTTPPVVFTVRAPDVGPGSVTLSGTIFGDEVSNNNSGSDSVSVFVEDAAPVELTLEKTAPATAQIDQDIVYTLTVSNVGEPAATQLRLSDALPSGMTLIAVDAGQWFCNSNLSSVDCNRAVLGSGQQSQIQITVRADAAGEYLNEANLVAIGVPIALSDTALTRIEELQAPLVELTLEKNAPASAEINQDIVYTLTVANVGETTATQLSLSDTLPGGMTLISVDAGDWFCNSSTSSVNCNRDLLDSGQQSQVSITVRADSAGDYLNEAQLTATDAPVALTDTALTRIEEVQESLVDLMLTKTDSVDPVAPGALFSYSLTVTNLSNVDATGVTITETFPAGMVVVDARGSNWSCSAINICQLTVPLLGGQSSVLTFDVLAPTNSGTITNRAEVRSLEVETRPEDNSASEQTVVTGAAAVADLKVQADSSGSLQQGEPKLVSVRVSNAGPNTAESPLLTGTIAGAVSLVGAANQSVECTFSGSTFSCPLAALGPGDSVGVGVVIRGTAANGSGSLNVAVSSLTNDPMLANNAAQVDFSLVSLGADLGVELSDSADPATPGGSFEYRLRLTNNGPLPAEQANLIINLDSVLTVTAQNTPGLNCTPVGATSQTCSLATPLGNSSLIEATFIVQVPVQAKIGLTTNASVTSPLPDPNQANNTDTETTAVGAPSAAVIRDKLDEAVANDPIAGPAVNPTAERCASADGTFADLCNQILVAPAAEVREVLAALAPEENLAQATVLRELSFAQFFNVDARMAELRGAGGGFSSAGLNLSTRTGSLGFDQLSQMLGDERQSDDAGGLFSSPWGFFVNGTISSGDQSSDRTSGQVGVDFESRGLTAGVDYRFSTSLVVGAAIGYANFDADVSGDSELDTTGYTITGYGSWYPAERFYIDGRVSFGQVEMDQSRRVRFTLNGQTTDVMARGSADADQFSLAFGGGYHLNRGAWNITPNASLRYTNSDVDGFTERGGSDFALAYDSTSTDALIASAGMQLSRAFSLSRGIVTPQLSLSWNFEDRGDELAVTGRFASTNGSEAFRYVSPDTDSNYGALGLGFVFIGANGVQAYINYRTVFGYEDFDRDTVNVGARFEF